VKRRPRRTAESRLQRLADEYERESPAKPQPTLGASFLESLEHAEFDEYGAPLNKAAERILAEEERSLEEYNSTHMGGKRNWLKD
jgi:hypothetical protein